MRGGMKVMPPIFFSENGWMIQTSFAIMRLFFHKVFIIFNTLLQILSKTLYTSVVNILPWLNFETHHISIHCHLQNGIHIMYPSQGQTDGSHRVLDLGCEYDDEVHPIFAITSHVHKVV
jgi:hypothetical protein